MLDIPLPPLPHVEDILAYSLSAGGILLGAALLVWGRLLGRPLAMLLMGLAGYLLGQPASTVLATWGMAVPPVVCQFVLFFVMVALGFILERLLWGLLAAALIALPVVGVMVARMVVQLSDADRARLANLVPTSAPAAGAAGLEAQAAYFTGAWQQMSGAFGAVWNDHFAGILTALCVTVAFPLLVAVLRPRFIRIVMTSVVGATLLVLGLAMAVSQPLEWFWDEIWRRAYVPAALVLGLVVLGIVVQYRSALKHDRKEAKDEETPVGPSKADREKAEQAELKRLTRRDND